MSLLRIDQNLTKHSYYAATAPREQRHPALQGSLDCDVAVVGGGPAGLGAAVYAASGAPTAGSGGRNSGRSSRTRSLSTVMPRVQRMRSAMTSARERIVELRFVERTLNCELEAEVA